MRAARTLLFAICGLVATQGCDGRPTTPLIPGSTGVKCTKSSSGCGVYTHKLEKLDLLFVVGDSPSMRAVQTELARRVPELLAAVTLHTRDVGASAVTAVNDIHVGVISSSLGSHGTAICDPALHPEKETGAHLLPREARCDLAAASAVTWIYDPKAPTPGPAADAKCVLSSVGTEGCEYQETWESAYHFLVDPKPYLSAKVKCEGDDCGSNKIEVSGVDTALLAERAAFLRDDSVLAVVVVSDQNDASLKPAGLNWLPWAYAKGTMLHGWSKCAEVPDDLEPESAAEFDLLHTKYGCKSCFEDNTDPSCKSPWSIEDGDDRRLRAFEQTRRFGYNFLYGRQRYVNAFTNATAIGADGVVAANPIFKGGFRTKDLILVAAIVGVPEALVAQKDLDWAKIIGPDRDPHMFESIAPRSGLARFEGDRAVDPISGGELELDHALQAACIAESPSPAHADRCKLPGAALRDPQCTDAIESHIAATPGLRHLRIVHDIGDSGFVASICQKSLAPTMAAIAGRIRDIFNQECIQSEVAVKDNQADCLLFEVLPDDPAVTCEQLAKGLCTPGAAPCRNEGSDYPPVSIDEAAGQLTLTVPVGPTSKESVACKVENGNVIAEGSDGKKHRVCEARQLVGADGVSCRTEKKIAVDPAVGGGWCYTQDPALLSRSCTLGTLRFGGEVRRDGAEIITVCASPSG